MNYFSTCAKYSKWATSANFSF